MDVTVTHFNNPFSFFLKEKAQDEKSETKKDGAYTTRNFYSKKNWSDVNHGKYVAVWHQKKWSRGIIHLENQPMIWLVDSGCYIRPNDSTVYADLRSGCKKLPSKVFEASIHGVVPTVKNITPECETKEILPTSWNPAAIQKGLNIIKNSRAIYFVPVALMSTKGNDIVLGDLYADTPGQGIENFIDLMELWPVFVQRNPDMYIENINKFYPRRRKHHACALKPVMPNREVPVMTTLTCTITEYQAIAQGAPKLELPDATSTAGSTVATNTKVQHPALSKIKIMSNNLRYKDRKSSGSATTRRSNFDRPADVC